MPEMKKDFTDLDGRFPKLRREYHYGTLERKDLARDPFKQFAKWFQSAVRLEQKPNAMTLATAPRKGSASARILLLKGFDPQGFTFYTSYESQKAREIKKNPKGSLVFYWPAAERQVRISGIVKKMPKRESEIYFRSRPVRSRLVSWASRQSRVIEDRRMLEEKIKILEKRFKGRDIPLPPTWGGYRLEPHLFEFWQGRKNRLNDRFRYCKARKRWIIERLQP